MLEPDTLVEMVNNLDEVDAARILKTHKSHVAFYINLFNAGYTTAILLTDFPKPKEGIEYVPTEEVQAILKAGEHEQD